MVSGSYDETIRPSYGREVTVTFTITYSPSYRHPKCVEPDGTVYDSSVQRGQPVSKATMMVIIAQSQSWKGSACCQTKR